MLEPQTDSPNVNSEPLESIPEISVESVEGSADSPDQVSINRQLGIRPIWNLDAKVEWLIADFIPLKAITLLTAEAGTGKTWVAHAIAGCVAHGNPFIGLAVKERPVLYLDGENPLAVVRKRLQDLNISASDDLSIWGLWHGEEPPGPDKSTLFDIARRYEPLLIFDSLIFFHSGDEQSATETRKFMNHLRKLSAAGATIVILHHTGKASTSKRYRGSSDIEAAVDMAYHLDGNKKKGGAVDRLRLTCFKSRFAEGKDFGLRLRIGAGFERVDVPQEVPEPSVEAVVTDIISSCPEGLNGEAIKRRAKEQRVGKHAVEDYLKSWPHKKRGRGNENIYLPPPTDSGALRLNNLGPNSRNSQSLEYGNTGDGFPTTPRG